MVTLYKQISKFVVAPVLLGFLLVPVSIADPGRAEQQKIVINAYVDGYVLPAYQSFVEETKQLTKKLKMLCEDRQEERLVDVQMAFTSSVLGWSRVLPVRFGPIRLHNRMERVFFWPDTKSRVSKHTSRLLQEFEGKDIDFTHRSIAAQGLPALEYLLYSSISRNLLDAEKPNCGVAVSISKNIYRIATDILAEWNGDDGYRAVVLSPGPENQTYRTADEALAEILKSTSEILQLIASSMLNSSLQGSPDDAKAKRAPFWRSDLTLQSLQVTLGTVKTFVLEAHFSSLMKKEDQGLGKNLIFELDQALGVFSDIHLKNTSWVELVKTPEGHAQLTYLTNPVLGAHNLLAEEISQAMGINVGFNSLDGD